MFQMGGVTRQPEELFDREAPPTGGTLDMECGIHRDQGNGNVRWVGGRAVLACPENRMSCVETFLGSTAGPGLALVTANIAHAEVGASDPL